MKFKLGKVVVTTKAAEVLSRAGWKCEELAARHQQGDWGDVTDAERQLNDDGLRRQFNLVSHYVTDDGERITVVTMADRSSTLVHVEPSGKSAAPPVSAPHQRSRTAARSPSP